MLAAGLVVFLGLVLLGGLTGLLWHIYTFAWWVKLSPSILGPTADWFLWGLCFILTLSPTVVAVFRRRISVDPVLVLVPVVLPVLSLAAISFSYFVGATLLVGSGFLSAYTLVSRSSSILTVDRGLAVRVVSGEVFGLLALISAGGVVSVLLWQQDFFLALVSGSYLASTDYWLSMLAIDLEVFYLARPLLLAIFIILAVAAIVTLFWESFKSITGSLVRRLMIGKHPYANDISASPARQSARITVVRGCLPHVILAASVLLGIAITTYPYTVVGVSRVLGSDSWYYLRELGLMHTFADIPPRLQSDRGLFLFLLFMIKTATGVDAQSVIEWVPALLSALLAVSSYVFVREGTGRSWLAAFASVLSVVSAQTSLGMGAFILTNWFALSIANFMLAFVVRSLRRRSTLSAVGAIIVSLVLLASYAFLWVVIIAELALVLLASILAFRNADRRDWKREVESLGGVLVGSILTPIAFLFFVVMPLLGFRPQGLDVSTWLMMGWNYLAQGATPQVLSSALTALEKAFDFAGNRADLPFLTLLSIVGLLDQESQHRSFASILSAMILVPVVTTMVTPDLFFTWRGLYIMPMYVTGALGAESIIRRVNGHESPWSPSRLAFAAAFTAYLFLSQLSYSLRALELLILVAG